LVQPQARLRAKEQVLVPATQQQQHRYRGVLSDSLQVCQNC
jgi:hypothetical protein